MSYFSGLQSPKGLVGTGPLYFGLDKDLSMYKYEVKRMVAPLPPFLTRDSLIDPSTLNKAENALQAEEDE